jgi:hypothetical protein
MDIVVVSNGFPGQLLPYQIHTLNSAQQPTSAVIEIRQIEDLIANVHRTNPDLNPVLPVPNWPTGATLPSGDPGNHFVLVEFTRPIRTDSVIDLSAAGGVNFGLTGAITVTALDPLTGVSTPIPGRAFVDGFTPDPANPGSLVRWVGAAASGQPVALQPQGLGFPGVLSSFPDAARLVQPQSFVFVPDADGNLSTFETFPAGKQIQVKCATGVKAKGGDLLIREAHASSTVGPDSLAPEVLRDPTTTAPAVFVEVNGQMVLAANQTGVSPLTPIDVEFTEPVQPGRVGQLPSPVPPGLSPSTSVSFGPPTSQIAVTFTAAPVSPYNLARYRLQPSFNFPGSDPVNGPGEFNTVNVSVAPGTIADLRYNFLNPNPSPINLNTQAAATFFETGEGPGLVNAVVSPGALYVGRNGSEPGLSVIDLNGFGAGTGLHVTDDPNTPQVIEWFWDQIDPTKPHIPTSKFKYNANLQAWGSGLVPPITQGNDSLNGGSGGVFSLARDSALSDRVVRPPILTSVADIAIGRALDTVVNNSQAVCAVGGGNICANDGFRSTTTNFFENTIQVEPEPNPPQFLIPLASPLCVSPLILGKEVTSVAQPPGITNVMGQGSFFGNPAPQFGVPTPPTGYYHSINNGAPGFLGPVDAAAAGGDPTACAGIPWFLRQQVGHFLYVVDPVQDKIVVLNSNRMTLIDTIALPDPTRLALEPNLKRLAVSNFATDTVSMIDIDPTSPTFHQIVATIVVGNGPLGIAWEPDNEDLFVCNNLSSNVSIIAGFTLTVRKTIANQIVNPIDIAITTRQLGIGLNSQLYYAYILNQTGTVATFESGPDGTNGIGFDNVIGILPFDFPNPTAIQPDLRDLMSGAWVTHRTAQGQPTVSHIHLHNGPAGALPLNPTAQFNVTVSPSFRDKEWTVDRVVAPAQLTGFPTDIAFDDVVNIGAGPQIAFAFAPAPTISQDSKQQVRPVPGGLSNVNFYTYLFVSNPSSGTIDVIDATSMLRVDVDPVTPGVQSIQAPGAAVVCNYWRM